jgi:nucleoside-diphosphate-sugar epimerase
MHVFVTGGTGLVGSAVVAELLAYDHTVSVLARSDAGAATVEAVGGTPVRGALADLDVLCDAAAQADGVIHLAFSHDFSTVEAIAAAVAQESAALETMGDALVGSDRPLVVVSGTPRADGRPSTEADPPAMEGPVAGRSLSVARALDLASRGVRSSAVRLPRTVHRDGYGGFAGMLVDLARRTGVSGYVGDGAQRWPAVHALDAAALFRLALENAPAGTSWHAVADEGDAMRDIAEVIGRRLGVPAQSVPAESFGPLGAIFAADQPSSSAHTREALGWTPTRRSLLDDLEGLRP